ncbi:unnamed protein product [Symbiodinium sp. CCMP2592]|nr:unnamed protein product [Symbiodinium sp. CCMP2592]
MPGAGLQPRTCSRTLCSGDKHGGIFEKQTPQGKRRPRPCRSTPPGIALIEARAQASTCSARGRAEYSVLRQSF